MKLAGICRARNEEHIIGDTLDHVAKFCNAGIYVYDDSSTDSTVEICLAHEAVVDVFMGEPWDPTPEGRQRMEGYGRQVPYDLAVADGADWIYCFDADEFAEFSLPDQLDGLDAFTLRLFDFYITPDDSKGTWKDRRRMGPEFRDIPMIFRAQPGRRWGDRVPGCSLTSPAGYVRHYGKAISVPAWEEACEYYANHRWKGLHPDLQQRWEGRRGRAIHTRSDFDNPLIWWGDRFDTAKIVRL